MDNQQRALLRRLSWTCLGLSGLVGLGSLVGWLASKPEWVAPIPGLMPMHPRSAVLMMLCATSLALLIPPSRSRVREHLAHGLGLLVALMALSSLLNRLSIIDWTLGGGLFEKFGVRMSGAPFGASVSYLLSGLSLLLLDHSRRKTRAAQMLMLVAMAIAGIALAGYLYDVTTLAGPHAIGPTRGMTFYTSLAVGMFGVALLCARSEYGFMAAIASRRSGGVYARRMLAGILVLPLAVSLVVIGERSGLYDERLAEASLSVFAVLFLLTVIIVNAKSMNRLDAQRARAAEQTAQALERASQQRTWLQLVIEQIPEGIILLDDRGRMATMNKAARALACGPVRGKKDAYGNDVMFDVRDLSGRELAEPDMPLVRALRNREEIHELELQLVQRDGKHVPVLVSALPVRRSDGAMMGALTMVQDITARKELDRLREEWSSLVAHDLRQPATVISFASQLLPKLHQGSLTPSETRALERIQGASQRLKRMIDDLLDFSRIEAQRLSVDKRPLELSAMIPSIVERTAELSGARMTVAADARALILGDAVRMEQLLVNLLSNAVKYGDAQEPIRVELRNRPGAVYLSVINHGRGIAEAELPKLFSRFTRTASAVASPVEGLGLGLYICKGIVEAHGGRIWAESTPGETTAFHVLLPAPDPVPQRPESESHVD